VTVPESLRADAANESKYSARAASADQAQQEKASQAESKAAQSDKKTVEKPMKAAAQKTVKAEEKGKAVVVRENPSEKKASELDIDETIRASSIPDNLFDVKNRFSKIESRIALSAFAFIVFALAASWMSWDKDYAIVGNADTAYNYGLVGGIMMLVILIYALRKRLKMLRRIGDIKYWYYFHFIFGVVGPVLIVLHTSFSIRSINGGVALFAMFSIVFSGFIGRYIYTRASYGLRAVEQDLQVVTRQLEKGVLTYQIPAMAPIEQQLRAFSMSSLAAPRGFFRIITRILFLKHRAKLAYSSASQKVTKVIRAIAVKEKWTKSEYKERVQHEKRLISGHLVAVSGIASSRAFEKLAAKWRLLHVPILYILVLSGLAHVLAVHMY
jgi:hypothetical protein